MAICYFCEETRLPHLKRRQTSRWIHRVAARHGKRVGEISYLFCTDEKILSVNRTYLQHDYYTDIITFDYTEGDTLSGDIYISLDTVRSNAEQYGIPFEEELDRIIIHGILHLCGQSDKSDSERREMTRLEDEALALRETTSRN